MLNRGDGSKQVIPLNAAQTYWLAFLKVEGSEGDRMVNEVKVVEVDVVWNYGEEVGGVG